MTNKLKLRMIDGVGYYMITEIKEAYPHLGGKYGKLSSFVNKYDVEPDDMAYARTYRKDGKAGKDGKKWTETLGNSLKYDKLFVTEQWFNDYFSKKVLHESINKEIDDDDDSDTINYIFKANAPAFPAIYLCKLGIVKHLRKSMSIDTKFDDDSCVYKYGFSENLKERTRIHRLTFSHINNVTFILYRYSYVDIAYLSKAEKEIKKLCESYDAQLGYKNMIELVVLNRDQLIEVEKKYKSISDIYSGQSKTLKAQIKQLETDNALLKKDLKYEEGMREKEKKACRKETELYEKEKELRESDKRYYEMKISALEKQIKQSK